VVLANASPAKINLASRRVPCLNPRNAHGFAWQHEPFARQKLKSQKDCAIDTRARTQKDGRIDGELAKSYVVV